MNRKIQNVILFIVGMIVVAFVFLATLFIYINVDELWRLGIVQSTPGSMIFVVIGILFTKLMLCVRDMNQRIKDGYFN